MNYKRSFHNEIYDELDIFNKQQQQRFPEHDTLKVDLHCHDFNSDIPDELLGRILGIPETWLKTEDLLKTLQTHGCDTYTITNHNNARSCFESIDKGIDMLVGAEFSCMVPDFDTGIHVLTYGFTPEQEVKLNKLRHDLYRFLDFTNENDIPTIWAHPLFHYKSKGVPPIELFDKLALCFERFEVLNGQRDTWQNMLVKSWVDTLDEEKLRRLSKKHGIKPDRFCKNPFKKTMAGGSDSHMGIFSGLTGSRLYIPDLQQRLQHAKKSELVLEAIRNGDISPFGSHSDSERMMIAFLDFFCQIGINIKDPGLVRLLLHKGDASFKAIAFALLNGFQEIKRHRLTSQFLKMFHDCFSGKIPGMGKRIMVTKTYKNIFKKAITIAEVRQKDPEKIAEIFQESIEYIFNNLNEILVQRLETKLTKLTADTDVENLDPNDIIKYIEFPTELRKLLGASKYMKKNKMVQFDAAKFFDGLSFPFLASSVILSASFTSAKVLYNSRPLLDSFSKNIGKFQHPNRMLWLTDTFEDSNGVAMVLQSMLKEIQKKNLPIDLLVCSSTLKSEDNLIVIPPISEFELPFYKEQPIRIPNFLQIHKLFKEGEYDRLICSTEGVMGLATLYLKYAYTVKAYFYVHTDWMMFAEKVLNFDQQSKNRMRRIIRAFYKGFDGLFVLNSDQQKWLTRSEMGFKKENVFLTAHWAEEMFKPEKSSKAKLFGVHKDAPVVLFTGRISHEKGVMELPGIMQRIKKEIPNAVLVLAGKGPCEDDLKKAYPDAIFLGWVNHAELPAIYSAADVMILPSKFDTFGCVVLESLCCACPVVAYKTKGPKDIIINGESGYVVRTQAEMANAAIKILKDDAVRSKFSKNARKRSKDYYSDKIMKQFLKDVKLYK